METNPSISMSTEALVKQHNLLVALASENIELRSRFQMATQYIEQLEAAVKELNTGSEESSETSTVEGGEEVSPAMAE